MTATALLKTTISIEEWLAATTFVKQRSIIHKFFFLGTTTLDYSVFLYAAISLRYLCICR